MKYILVIGIMMLLFISCQNRKNNSTYILKFKDDFESGWKKEWAKEFASDYNGKIVSDPLNQENKVLKLTLNKGDVAGKGRYSNGYRTEVVLSTKDSMNSIVKYSFKFLLPPEFFQKEEKQGWIMLHQWHDDPAVGYTWNDCKGSSPPYNLYIQHNPDGTHLLRLAGGLRIGSINEVSHLTYKDELIPNHWYTFENEIKWHVYGKFSYCKPKLDGEDFSKEKKERIYTTRNMYNSKPNYFKMGLYWSGIEENSRSVYFDDISFYNKI